MTLVISPDYTTHLACRFQVMTTSTHCWFPSLLNSATNISSPVSYIVTLILVSLAQAQHVCATLQSHLFGTEMKMLVL